MRPRPGEDAYGAQAHGLFASERVCERRSRESLIGRAGSHGRSAHPLTWSSAIILSPSSSSSSSFEEQVAGTGGGVGVQAEAGSSAGHLMALACGLGPASSLLACGRFKPQILA